MIITTEEIKKQFAYWNEKAFNNELPVPTFELTQTKRTLGQFCSGRFFGEPTYKIRISIFYDRPLSSYIDTIVHEMLHFYIKYKGIKDNSSHGRIWKRMATDLSYKFNLNIKRTNPAGGGINDAIIERNTYKRDKHEYVFVCKLKDGRYGASVAPSSKLYKLDNAFREWALIKEHHIVFAPWSQTFMLRHLRTACGIRYITKERYDELMQNKQIQALH